MKSFAFQRVAVATDAASVVAANPGAMFLAGGTTLVDLMKIDVLTPDTVVDVRLLGLSRIDVLDDAMAIGAAVTNSQLAWHPVVRERYPVLSEAILSGAATQIRNMASVAGKSCSERAARTSEMFMRRVTGGNPDPVAMPSKDSTAGTPYWASATTASRRIHPTCVSR